MEGERETCGPSKFSIPRTTPLVPSILAKPHWAWTITYLNFPLAFYSAFFYISFSSFYFLRFNLLDFLLHIFCLASLPYLSCCRRSTSNDWVSILLLFIFQSLITHDFYFFIRMTQILSICTTTWTILMSAMFSAHSFENYTGSFYTINVQNFYDIFFKSQKSGDHKNI